MFYYRNVNVNVFARFRFAIKPYFQSGASVMVILGFNLGPSGTRMEEGGGGGLLPFVDSSRPWKIA